MFLPNEAEACALADLDPDAALYAARALQATSGGWVVVKLGPRGCLAVGPGRTELDVPAPVVSVADTTGAGDAFNAGLVHALSDGADWPDALHAATRFASMIVARPSRDRYRPGLRSWSAPEVIEGALLFDLDGVLVDSIAAVARAWSWWARGHGLDPAPFVAAHGRPVA